MDYKRIIKNQKIRFKILHFFRFVPDDLMIKIQYKIKLGKIPDLKKPKRYSEKLQWYKLNYRTPLMTQCADKYQVRTYIESKGLTNILNELYAIYHNVDEINFEELPNEFVMKTTNGSGTNILCRDKSNISVELVKSKLSQWIKRDCYAPGREWAYKDITPCIIVEKYLKDEDNRFEGINDYKFMCFNGEIKYIVLDVDRQKNHKRNIYDVYWNFIDVNTDHPNFGDVISKPSGLEDMLKVAKILAKDFPCVRVDLYWVNGKVYFGELTFYPWSGYIHFEPDDFDFIMGKHFKLPEVQSCKR